MLPNDYAGVSDETYSHGDVSQSRGLLPLPCRAPCDVFRVFFAANGQVRDAPVSNASCVSADLRCVGANSRVGCENGRDGDRDCLSGCCGCCGFVHDRG